MRKTFIAMLVMCVTMLFSLSGAATAKGYSELNYQLSYQASKSEPAKVLASAAISTDSADVVVAAKVTDNLKSKSTILPLKTLIATDQTDTAGLSYRSYSRQSSRQSFFVSSLFSWPNNDG